MTKDNTFNDSVWLYENSYGSALKISRASIITSLIVLAIITPFTNWTIPIIPKLVKKGIKVRYE